MAVRAGRKTATKTQHTALDTYAAKRDFERTAEPRPDHAQTTGTLRFVIQKHAATRLHYDVRLELDGVLKSWAVPKGPSIAVGVRRLAVHVEDHPIRYGAFEGTIPKGEYGGGTVMVWDQGHYAYVGSDPDPAQGLRHGLRDGKVRIRLEGVRLQGIWNLVRAGSPDDRQESWLLMRSGPRTPAGTQEPVDVHMTSVLSGRSMEEIAADAG